MILKYIYLSALREMKNLKEGGETLLISLAPFLEGMLYRV
jgi:hypothetical protein